MRPDRSSSVGVTDRPPLSWVVSKNVEYMVSAVVSTLCLLPIALVVVPGPTRVIGVVYAIVWAILFVPTMAACLWIVIDCIFMLTNRYPLLLPRLVEDASRQAMHERRAISGLRAVVRFWFMATPLSNLATASLFAVQRVRPGLIGKVMQDATDRARDDCSDPPDPQIVLAEGAASRFVGPRLRELEPA